jgi:hypothetical protein
MNDEKDHPGETVSTTRDTGRTPGNSPYGGEVETGPGGPQPRWLRFFYLALYVFAMVYMLRYAGDRWIIRIVALALAGWAAYSFRDLFRPRRG